MLFKVQHGINRVSMKDIKTTPLFNRNTGFFKRRFRPSVENFLVFQDFSINTFLRTFIKEQCQKLHVHLKNDTSWSLT